ncbi:MAG TPA: pyridoxamine 5'-phosphate oxidase family protein [Microbacterium sp.]|nr:pyridoxamine 5'-phosphate oxidase family protein [Microbacterium sp.]
MSENDVQSLGRDECRALLQQGGLGRIAASAAGEVDIFPVNFTSDGDSILIRTSPGTKLLELTIHADVAFELDGHDAEVAWSVIAHGRARQLDTADEIARAEAAGLVSWMPTPKDRYVQIDIGRLTGLRFRRVAHRSIDDALQEDAS